MHEIGSIVEGKVTGITKFGAFVEMDDSSVGMVHISEIAATYVNDISEHLTVGQTVKVKVININEAGKIGLSIKKALPQTEAPKREGFNNNNRPSKPGGGGFAPRSSAPPRKKENSVSQPYDRNSNLPKGPANFEDMLSKFMTSSEDKFSEVGMKKQASTRRGSKRPQRDYD